MPSRSCHDAVCTNKARYYSIFHCPLAANVLQTCAMHGKQMELIKLQDPIEKNTKHDCVFLSHPTLNLFSPKLQLRQCVAGQYNFFSQAVKLGWLGKKSISAARVLCACDCRERKREICPASNCHVSCYFSCLGRTKVGAQNHTHTNTSFAITERNKKSIFCGRARTKQAFIALVLINCFAS
jgi:hypothetical protein